MVFSHGQCGTKNLNCEIADENHGHFDLTIKKHVLFDDFLLGQAGPEKQRISGRKWPLHPIQTYVSLYTPIYTYIRTYTYIRKYAYIRTNVQPSQAQKPRLVRNLSLLRNLRRARARELVVARRAGGARWQC